MRQILYVSLSTVPGDGADLATILQQSRHNNALDGITGLLWSDGKSFLQVLEGPNISVKTTFDRVRKDSRHHSLIVLNDERIGVRQFGTWNMTHRRVGDPVDAYDALMKRLLSNASSMVRDQFTSLITTGAIAPHA